MTPAIRLLFDDCLSKHVTAKLSELNQFARVPVEIAHLATLNMEGALDDDWVPRIAEQGYLVLTADRGKKRSRGGKLPIICRRHGVSFVLMSSAVHKMDQFDKMRAVVSVWPKLLAAHAGEKGIGYILRKTIGDGFDLVRIAEQSDA